MSHDNEHQLLIDALKACSAAVVLSGYTSELYDQAFAGWHRHEIAAYTGQGNHVKTNDRRVEVLWSNRPLGRPHLFSGHEVAL